MRTHRILPLAAMALLFSIAPRALAQAPGPNPPPAPPPSQEATDAAREETLAAELLTSKPGGITADVVGKRAAATSFQAAASAQALRGAAARVDAAWASFLPRLSGTLRYTRLSDLTPPNLFSTGGQLVATQAPPGTLNPTPTVAIGLNFSFPVVVDNWLMQGTLAIPLSDYVFRLNQNYSAASKGEQAARFDVASARAKSAADGKIAYYNWIRARGSMVVAQLALGDQKTHLVDTKNLFQVGNTSQVDVLRSETGVAAAELAVEQTKHFVELTETQIRLAIHGGPDEVLIVGEAIEGELPPFSANLASLISEGQMSRFEVKSIDATAEALHLQATVVRAGQFPRLDAVGNVTYANPNQRLVPTQDKWFPTWDVSLQLTWSPNDVLSSRANGADVDSKAAQVEAQRQVLRDGIALEVTQSYQAVLEADFSVASTQKQLATAREAVRVARELFKAGRVTSTTLTDAETELTRARLQTINARVDARVARVRLDHALGRDTKDVKVD